MSARPCGSNSPRTVKALNLLSVVARDAAETELEIGRENVMKRSMVTNPALINRSESGSGLETTNIQRRTVIGGALVALLSSPGRAMAKEKAPKDPFVLLLNGPYRPVTPGTGPDLGLSNAGVDLNDGSYVKTQIFPVHVEGIPCDANENTPIGTFYVQGAGSLAAYELPGGAMAMQFIPGCGELVPSPDGQNGFFLNGNLELTILEATGIFRSFKHGHNHMVDRLHQLDAAGTQFDEYCFCFITRHGESE
jgi:hypothetical protein